MGPLPGTFSVHLTHEENIAKYLKDSEAGSYDPFRTDAGETYNIECRTFWTELRHRAAQATLDYVNAMNKKGAESLEVLKEQVQELDEKIWNGWRK